MKNLISLNDLTKEDIESIFRKTAELKGKRTKDLDGRTLAMFFEKPSTRTRVSFEVAMTQLGGHAIYLDPQTMQLKRGETIGDTAAVLSRYVDAIMARVYKHETLLEMAKHASVPIINGLSDFSHPCQILADLYTVLEKKGTLNLKFVWLGDGNNVCNSFVYAATKLGFQLVVSTPEGYEPKAKGSYELVRDPKEAVKGADVVITDTWISMGDVRDEQETVKIFKPYQVNSELVELAKPDYMFMHCLPAHREYEVTSDIIDGPNSIVFDEAENRLHVQKAILALLIGN